VTFCKYLCTEDNINVSLEHMRNSYDSLLKSFEYTEGFKCEKKV